MINNRYIVGKKLGEGRSKVFSIIDTDFPEREVAAKFLPASVSIEEKNAFRDEFFTLQKLDHPHIIKSFEISTVLRKDDDEEIELSSPFITLENFSSTELLEYTDLKNERKLFKIIKQICSVLYYLHQSNYIYYDLKPQNILITEIDDNPFIKIIDLGLSQFTLKEYEPTIKGTSYFIAPEILKNEMHDHTVDFYSLGIMLYRIVYGKYPFKSDNELDIYKEHIESEFILPQSNYSDKITAVIQKLIKKNPAERYNNALQIILDLGLEIDMDLTKDIIPAKVFSDRKDAYNILTTYLKDKKSNEVFTVRGFDGSGKTSLLYEINEKNPQSVLIENTKTKTGIDAVKYILKKIIFNENTFKELQINYSELISKIFDGDSNLIEIIKQIFNNLQPGFDLIILLDDFNLYDEFTIDVLLEVLPILQVKRIKIILSESSDYDHSAAPLSNLCDIQLSQFTDHQLSEFLDLSYSGNFPKRELKKYILLYADLLPGNIKQFIKDLIILKVMKFDKGEVSFQADENIVLALQSSHEEIYRLRLSNLNPIELKLTQLISAFEISVEQTILATLMDLNQWDLKNVLSELAKKNIIEPLNISNAPQINSYSFKRYIYSTISNKTKFHVILANSLRKLFPDFNSVELSRQYELANEYDRAVEVIKKEIDEAERIFAFKYKRALLDRILKFPLNRDITNQIRYQLIQTLYKLNDYKAALDNIYKLDFEKIPEEYKNEIVFIKGSCLIGLRKSEEGRNTLAGLKSNTKEIKLVHKIFVELASAEFDLGNYDYSIELCKQVIENPKMDYEEKGRCFNLLGIIEFEVKNNIPEALNNFTEALKYFQLHQSLNMVSRILSNIGNIYQILNKPEMAEQTWNKSLEINSKVGNLEQEAIILLNFGNYYQDKFNFEKAIKSWQDAEVIFNTIGSRFGQALAISNLGEVYLQTCEYQNSFDYLNQALTIFRELENKEEENNTLFLLGKFWFVIGHLEELEKFLNQLEYNIYTGQNISEKTQILHQYLKLMFSRLDVNNNFSVVELLKLLEKCKELGETNLYLDITYFYIEYLINNQRFDDALKSLNDNNLLNQINNNLSLKAQREYYLGRIADISKKSELKSAIDYVESALSIIEDQSISELTWKVLFSIAEIYWERGNFHKARRPRFYAAELLSMISEHITSNKIRVAYLEKPERKKALEKLKQISTTEQINELQRS
jgi:serine/threonine protein kinase